MKEYIYIRIGRVASGSTVLVIEVGRDSECVCVLSNGVDMREWGSGATKQVVTFKLNLSPFLALFALLLNYYSCLSLLVCCFHLSSCNPLVLIHRLCGLAEAEDE